MHILASLLLIGISFVAGRIYEYRVQVKECENCDNMEGVKND
ncbi:MULTISPECIES: hypothetical protein [unclassified Clostridioides]